MCLYLKVCELITSCSVYHAGLRMTVASSAPGSVSVYISTHHLIMHISISRYLDIYVCTAHLDIYIYTAHLNI